MSATDQPYSDRAYEAAGNMAYRGLSAAMDAAHDREALGLEASVCARTFLDEIVAWLRSEAERCLTATDAAYLRHVGHSLLREFESRGGKP